ncbi:helix-turn-helix domain-containing protein [Salininema proteolyticum]|uniref:Helix-turn-helix domain-containing protein n=1 Tax=Salininema proteolyticum TaxID=1607685 RepID=A0ABV8U1A2_9ACTN
MGRRVAYWRGRRGMSQQVFADRLSKSKSWVDKIERGVRRLDKYSVITEIAAVLQIDAGQLVTSEPAHKPHHITLLDQIEIENIRQSLERYERLGLFLDAAEIEAPDLAVLRNQVAYTWSAYEKGHYPNVTRSLIELLRTVPAAESNAEGAEKAGAAELVSQVYQISSSVLRKIGESALAWLAADRAISAANRGDDELLVGTSATRVANALRSQGRHDAAFDINIQVAHGMISHYRDAADPETLSVYGLLLLQGAMAASHTGDTASTRDLLSSAEKAAQRLGGDADYYWTSFGPTNVELHKVAAHIELGEGHAAVQTAEKIPPQALDNLVAERRAHHHLDLSRACLQTGDMERAKANILTAHAIAPAEIQCRPIAMDVVEQILNRYRGEPGSALRRLASEVGVSA